MKAVQLVLRQVLFPEAKHSAQIIVVDIVPMDQMIEVADDADSANNLHLRAQLFAQFPMDCLDRCFPRLHTAAGGFDQRGFAENIVPLQPRKIEAARIVIDDCPCNLPIVIGICIWPFGVLQFQEQFFPLCHDFSLPIRKPPRWLSAFSTIATFPETGTSNCSVPIPSSSKMILPRLSFI